MEFTSKCYWEFNKIGQEILRAVSLGIGVENSGHLIRFHSGRNNQLRQLHCPQVPAEELEKRNVAHLPAHSD